MHPPALLTSGQHGLDLRRVLRHPLAVQAQPTTGSALAPLAALAAALLLQAAGRAAAAALLQRRSGAAVLR